MRIAQVVSTFPPQIGGMGQVSFEECSRLARAGHMVTVFTMQCEGANNVDANLPFKIIRLNPIIKAGDAGFVPQLLFKLRDFDVVHLHYPWYGGAEWVWLASLINKQKYVATYHMDAAPVGLIKTTVRRSYDAFLSKQILRKANKIIAVDADHLKYSKFGFALQKDKIVEIINGVDTNLFKPINGGAGLPGWLEKKIILFVGNPLLFKRLDFLFRAFKLVANPAAILMVLSGGYGIEEYKALAQELNIADRVKFVGRMEKREDLNKYYNAASCLVVPGAGSAESFSLVATEAMAAGCPVIAANTPGVRRRIEAGVDGLIFDINFEADLAEKISRLISLTPEQRELMGEKGRQKMLTDYSWDSHLKKLLAVYSV